MTQGQRTARLARTHFVRAALLVTFLCTSFASAQQPGDIPEGAPQPMPPSVPEGPPFAPSLKPEWLASVRDRTGLPTLNPNTADARAEGEFFAYLEAVKNARQVSVQGFANSVKPEVSVGHVLTEPQKYRGTVISVEGNLRRVRVLDTPAMLAEAHVEKLYEGWVFNRDKYADKPVCILFTELPQGVPVADKIDDPPTVTFDGYFFKVYRYESADPNKPMRIAPLLIGHAPMLRDAAREIETTGFWQPLIAGVIGLMAVVLVVALGMAWWLNRGDHKVSRTLADSSARKFIDQAEGGTGAGPDPNLN